MKRIFSKIDPDKLLHMVYFGADMVTEREEIIAPTNFLQVCSLKMTAGRTFRPHQHIWKDGPEKVIAQESWCIIKGAVEVSFYDTDGALLEQVIIRVGDISVTLEGGHTYTCLEDSVVYEYKTGPYTGIRNDKVFLDG